MIRLHGYYRSSTSYRLRIALELKGLDYEYVPVNLLESEQKGAAFTSRNPFGSVPLLEVDGKDYVQSMAQLEWLDEAYPDAPLLPGDAGDRYLARELAYAIATELHAPLNLPVLKYLAKRGLAAGLLLHSEMRPHSTIHGFDGSLYNAVGYRPDGAEANEPGS